MNGKIQILDPDIGEKAIDERGAIFSYVPKDDGVLYKVLDNTKMQREINYKPKTELRNGLEKTWRWYNG